MKKLIFFTCFVMLSFASYAQQKSVTHIVEQGETLTSIAAKYGIALNDLLQANGDIGSALFPGLLLNIPKKPQNVQTDDSIVAKKQNSDIVQLLDGSFVLCIVTDVRESMVLIKQAKHQGVFRIPIRDINFIQYMNGEREYFSK